MPQNLQNSIKVKINLPEFTPTNLYAVIYTVELVRGDTVRKICEGSNIDAIPDIVYFDSEDSIKKHLLVVTFKRVSSMNNLKVSFEVEGYGNINVKVGDTILKDTITTLQHFFA